MSTQPPVRYENYPPDDNDAPSGFTDEHAPVVRPYFPATIPPASRSEGTGRRKVLGLVIGIPIAGIVLAMASNGNSRDDPNGAPPDLPYPGDTEVPAQTDENFSVGDYSATVPEGWTVSDYGDTVEVTNGANRLTAVSIDTATSSLAFEEIGPRAKAHYAGFTGNIGDPVDRSSADLQHATMDGTGKFQGKSARLMAELWIDDTGAGLLVVRVLTAKVSSTISAGAQGMLEELSGDF